MELSLYGRLVGKANADGSEAFGGHLTGDGFEDLFLVGVDQVEGGAGDAGLFGEILHGDAAVAVAQENYFGGFEHAEGFFVFHGGSIDKFCQYVNTGISPDIRTYFVRTLFMEDAVTETIKKHWGVADIPDQGGRLAVVTGSTGGLGYETALGLALAGGEVVLAGRNQAKGDDALRRIRAAGVRGMVRFELLDLASLASVKDFVGRIVKQGRPIDLLVNNAGVMALPTRQTTRDGFELQFGTNHLGHFALTGLLLPLLREGKSPRVTTVSSLSHRIGAAIHFDDLEWTRGYNPDNAYAQSKLANMLFAEELQRRSDEHGWGLLSDAAHPGLSSTDLVLNGVGTATLKGRIITALVQWLGQSAAQGALPSLYAATVLEAKKGGYYGPNGWFEMKGQVAPAFVSKQANDIALARKLWDASEALTGVAWPR